MSASAVVLALAGPLAQPFVQHALLAGTAIALCSGLVGHFVVLRGQVFSGDALSHVAFTGAIGALALGVDLRLGLFAATIVAALGLGALGARGRADDAVIGSLFVWVLGLGVLFQSLFLTSRAAGDSTASTRILFGSIFGLDAAQALVAAVVGVATCAVLLAIARPLLFASVDEGVARARGVPVVLVGTVFLVLVGATAAEATQAVGALLLLGLLAAPAGIAQAVTANPWRALWLSAAIAVGATWTGLLVSVEVPVLPPSFAILAIVTVAYVTVLAATRLRRPAPGGDRAER